MKPVVSDAPPPRDHNIIHVRVRMHALLSQTHYTQWEDIFDQFRLNLQSRIAGADERLLLKLQGNIEYLNELEKFFKELLNKPA